MSLRSKSLLLAGVALAVAVAVLVGPHFRGPTVAADATGSTAIHRSAPVETMKIETMKIVPADVLGKGVHWMPATGEN